MLDSSLSKQILSGQEQAQNFGGKITKGNVIIILDNHFYFDSPFILSLNAIFSENIFFWP